MTTSKVTQLGLYAGTPQNAGQVKNNQSDEFSKIFASQSAQTENKTETKADTKTTEEVEKVEIKENNYKQVLKQLDNMGFVDRILGRYPEDIKELKG